MPRLPHRAAIAAALAATLAACSQAQRPPSPGSTDSLAAGLAGCQAGPVDRTTWRVQCGGLVAQIHDPYGEKDPALLALGEASVALVGGGVAQATPTSLPIAGATLDARRIRVSPQGKPTRVRATGLAAVVAFAEARHRLVWCVTSGAGGTRCDKVVDLLAGIPWRAGPPRSGKLPPELAGRPVLVPEGCEAIADGQGGDVACSSTQGWRWRVLGQRRDVAPSDLEYAENAEDAKRLGVAATEPVPAPPADGAPCAVDGVATRCSVKRSWGGSSVTIATVATVRGQPLELVCTYTGSPDEVPPLCDGLELVK